MAYTVVPTQKVGELWTADDHNTYIRDNFAAGVPDVFTTKGDIMAATAADAGTRVAIGANDSILQPDSGETTGIKWSYPWGSAAMYSIDQFSSQNIANNTTTRINFDTEDYDANNLVTSGAGSWVYTVPADGIYLVNCHMEFDTQAYWEGGEDVFMYLYDGSSNVELTREYMTMTASSGYYVIISGCMIVQASQNDTFYISILQVSDQPLYTLAGAQTNYVQIARML